MPLRLRKPASVGSKARAKRSVSKTCSSIGQNDKSVLWACFPCYFPARSPVTISGQKPLTLVLTRWHIDRGTLVTWSNCTTCNGKGQQNSSGGSLHFAPTHQLHSLRH